MKKVLIALVAALAIAGCTPSLHDVVARHDMEQAKAMLEVRPDLVQSRDGWGKTPLHHAVTYGNVDAIDLLLANGADINALDHTGMTPLHVASKMNHVEEAQALLDHGANLEARDSFGDTPLHIAALFGTKRMAEFLVKAGADLNALNNGGKTPQDCARDQRKQDVATLLSSVRE